MRATFLLVITLVLGLFVLQGASAMAAGGDDCHSSGHVEAVIDLDCHGEASHQSLPCGPSLLCGQMTCVAMLTIADRNVRNESCDAPVFGRTPILNLQGRAIAPLFEPPRAKA